MDKPRLRFPTNRYEHWLDCFRGRAAEAARRLAIAEQARADAAAANSNEPVRKVKIRGRIVEVVNLTGLSGRAMRKAKMANLSDTSRYSSAYY